MIDCKIITANPGQAADVNHPLTAADAEAFKDAGVDAIIRYVPRTPSLIAGNVTTDEIELLLAADLLVGFVQHCPLPGWQPSGALGTNYGDYAALYLTQIGVPPGALVWLDLEEVYEFATDQEVIDYVHAWYSAVTTEGYLAGLYVGYGTNLSGEQLYDLPVKNYWRAYNCDQNIPTRGYQILQHTAKILNGIGFDPNTVQLDHLGDLPIWLSPG